MKVLSDILDAADSCQVTLLALLDLSAAFGTVYHNSSVASRDLIRYWWICAGVAQVVPK